MDAVPAAQIAPAAPAVLVVDDNPTTRYATCRILAAAGYAPREAGSGEQAVEMGREGVDAVVLDVHLPDMDGYEVCRRLRATARGARVPVVHLSAARPSDHDKVLGMEAGADAYMTHPAEPGALVSTLDALLRSRAAEAQFLALYEQSLASVAIVDAEGRFAAANPGLRVALGREEEELMGREVSSFAPEAKRERARAFFTGAPAGRRRAEFPLHAADGREVHFEWSMVPVAAPGRAVAIATDISERVEFAFLRQALLEREYEARAEAERLSSAKDEFIAVLSHELRAPLNAIAGWAHALSKAAAGDPKMAKGLAAIDRNVRLQARLISDILDVSRLGSGKLRLELGEVDVPELVAEAAESLRAQAAEKGVRIRASTEPGLPRLAADAARLQQILWNLLTNAVKFSRPGGLVELRARGKAGGVEIEVKDQGEGMEPEFLARVFDRFAQEGPAGAKAHGGLGLGLSISKRLAELHGGSIEAESDGPGRGSTFRVFLPFNPAPSPGAAPAAEGPLADDELAGLAVLAVDDDEDARELAAMVLRDRGANAFTASSAREALAMLSAASFDALVSDVGMPEMDGAAMLRELRSREAASGRPAIPAVALTAFARQIDRQAALDAGFDEHLAKPLRPEALVRAVAAARAKRAAASG